jgi:transposase
MVRAAEERTMSSRGAEWAERVGRWRRSGRTAQEFARSIGVKAGTLKYWAWRLGHDARKRRRAERPRPRAAARVQPPQFIELIAGAVEDQRFELDLGKGLRLRIPPGFEAAALERVLRVVAGAR